MPQCSTKGCQNQYSVRGPVQSRMKKCALCIANIGGWEKRAAENIDTATEYVRRLRMRSDRMSYVVTEREVRSRIAAARREAREEARQHA